MPPALRSLFLLATLVFGAACAAPGVDVAPQPGDFAFLEIDLQG